MASIAISALILGSPLIARGANDISPIPLDKLVPAPKVVTWDEIIAPQLAERDRQNEAKQVAIQKAVQAAQAAQVVVAPKPAPYVPPVIPVGSHEDWMAAAGIAQSDFGYVNYIVNNESGWQVTIWNHGGSGAYGLGQALPAAKMAQFGLDYLTNPVTQLKWANAYAVSRYGSWHNAYAFWSSHRWW